MFQRVHHALVRFRAGSKAAGQQLHDRLHEHWSRGSHPPGMPVEVLIVERARRRTIERQLRRALDCLQRILGTWFPADCAVVVQHVVIADRQLAGCCQISQRSDGSRFALIRLALSVDGRQLAPDEVLAVLADQCVALAMQSAGPSLMVPVDLNPSGSSGASRRTPLRPDPLAPDRDFGGRSA